MVSEALFSSRRPDWCTPQALFDELDAEFHFTLDPCADARNHKCEKYYTEFEDGLSQNWSGGNGVLQSARRFGLSGGACGLTKLKPPRRSRRWLLFSVEPAPRPAHTMAKA